MTFLQKLENLMKKNNIKNLHELSTKSSIPYSTLRGFYTKGTDNIKLPTLRALAKFFNCSIDYLADDEIVDIKPYGDSNIDTDIETFQKTLKEHNLLDSDDELTDENFNNILEIIKANKKFILFTDESNKNDKWFIIYSLFF